MLLGSLMNSGHVKVQESRFRRPRCMIQLVLFLTVFSLLFANTESEEQCKLGNTGELSDCKTPTDEKTNKWAEKSNKRYILYDVNPGEGFNLRRDVYMRISGLVRKLIRQNPAVQWVLVLPPWGSLYHWQTKSCGQQTKIPWSHFFDLDSLGYYVPVMEFSVFLKHQGPQIDMVYYLQHDDWKNGAEFKDKLLIEECKDAPKYLELDGVYRGHFWGYENVYPSQFKCVTAQGYASSLKNLLDDNYRSILIDRAEVILHDSFGDADYWAARRSMRFSKRLRLIADDFRKDYLNSSDKEDQTLLDDDWRNMRVQHGCAKGGPFIAVHLRRKDFVHSRSKDVPSLKYAAIQIQEKQKMLDIAKVFVATDAPEEEYLRLKELLPSAIRFDPDNTIFSEIKDGGVAIVDQWICAHAAFFIGSFESTFSFRIQEEREILGFEPKTTFNRLCGDDQLTCQQPSKWKIVY